MKPTREEVLENALQKIARWHDEFPPTGQTWQDGTPISYGAAYGSNGERDYMRQVALDALAAKPDSLHVDKPLAESAAAPGECVSVPDEPSDDESLIACLGDDAAKLMQANPGDEMATTMLVAAIRISQLLSRLQPPNNQQNSDHLAAPTETATDTRLDAARWCALLSSGRIRILGSAGFSAPPKGYESSPDYRHFGMEIWTSYGKPGEYDFSPDNAYGRNVLTKYADAIIAAKSGISSPSHRPKEKDVVGEGK